MVKNGVDYATELGMYVIIDWHILSNNSLMHPDDTKDIFRKLAKRYHAYGNVIYEICNEPNVNCTWEDIKKYADEIIAMSDKILKSQA